MSGPLDKFPAKTIVDKFTQTQTARDGTDKFILGVGLQKITCIKDFKSNRGSKKQIIVSLRTKKDLARSRKAVATGALRGDCALANCRGLVAGQCPASACHPHSYWHQQAPACHSLGVFRHPPHL